MLLLPENIRQAIWQYLRFRLKFPDSEDLLPRVFERSPAMACLPQR
jgi:hypothetical protein